MELKREHIGEYGLATRDKRTENIPIHRVSNVLYISSNMYLFAHADLYAHEYGQMSWVTEMERGEEKMEEHPRQTDKKYRAPPTSRSTQTNTKWIFTMNDL